MIKEMRNNFVVAIGAGHHKYDSGAVGYGLKEHTEALKVVQTFTSLLPFNITALEFSGRIDKKIKQINFGKPDIGIEVHFNAGHDGAGTECLHCGSSESKLLAEILQNSLIRHLGLQNRRTKIGFYQQDPARGIIPILTDTVCPMVIVESLFIDNKDEAELLKKPGTIENIASALRDGIVEYFNSHSG